MDGISKNMVGQQQEERSSRNSGSAGSITTEKMKMLDITRDKPIKVAVKVAVPVRDHPKFNFVGKLLGPKGNSMKRLQEDTMCKMAVLGRGSMKDRKKEEELRASGEPRYAHLSEDLHVEISTFAAPAEAHARIAYALAEVRRFLVPDYHDDIRQEQMWEMQALSSSSSQTQTGEQNSPSSLNELDTNGDNKNHIRESMALGLDCITNEPTTSMNGIGPGQTTTNSITTCAATNEAAETSNQTNYNSALHVDLSTNSMHPTAVAAAIRHQLATAGMGIIKPATGVAAVTGLTPSQSTLAMPSEAEPTTPTLALLEPPGALLHPALRGVKAVNIVPLNYFQSAGSLARKRPLLGVPRSSMNPTKRTVMTLLARAKNSQAIHAVRNSGGATIPEPLQMITSPLILPQPMDENMIATQKESLSQGV
ncbi:branchpoint-bridging protein isoform X1 [Hermetia illucens]|uniref:branchpoint-bridging protein isoform X1 n=1 Tax=Hermetia illucens TaxID=343691 RepID=UPI0018CC5518|nr:branchpoint-bridging protein isoform X1 [Hermetia illucens]